MSKRGGLNIVAEIAAGLATLALGLSAGAVLAEAAVLVPWWRSLPADRFLSWYAANASRLFDFFGTVEIVSTVLAVVAGVLYRHQAVGSRGFFIAAAVLAVAVLVPFPLYFEQVNASFADGTIPLDQVAAELARWAAWHWVRTGLATAAFALTLLGVRASGRGRP